MSSLKKSSGPMAATNGVSELRSQIRPHPDKPSPKRRSPCRNAPKTSRTWRKTAPSSCDLDDGSPTAVPSLMACQYSPSPGSSILVDTSYTVNPRLRDVEHVKYRGRVWRVMGK